eukprot:CAMPEP_0179107846 /NCGR_PEP_ID=MMETSP0796-20121207/50210_1 /TAXON_ID=73915 /ORGANISM="Pyrodinium bahamense, Strain pbaha01" /LENGTH=132 /DNA_ID=CAMNT_0020805909 /DNA_START=59 /DNA_END=457 /DNA_ORIENTATION=+
MARMASESNNTSGSTCLLAFLLLAVAAAWLPLVVCPMQQCSVGGIPLAWPAPGYQFSSTAEVSNEVLGDEREKTDDASARQGPSSSSTAVEEAAELPESDNISVMTLFVAGAMTKIMASIVSSNEVVLAVGF